MELKNLGLISGLRRGHLYVGKPQAPALTVPAWQLRRHRLEQDILAGRYARQGSLPSFKELSATYEVCFRTMRKILQAMVADNALTMQGKSYRLPENRRAVRSNRVVMITHAFSSPPRSALNPGEFRVIDRLEHECVQRGYRLEVAEADFNDPRAARSIPAADSIRNPPLGFILDTWWLQEFRDGYAAMLDRLAKAMCPVAVLDEYNDYVLPGIHSVNPRVQVFRAEGRRAG